MDDSVKAEKIKSSIPSSNFIISNTFIAIKKVEISDKAKKEEKKQATGKKAPAKK